MEDVVAGAGEEYLARSGVSAIGMFEALGEPERSEIEVRRCWGVVGCENSVAGRRDPCEPCEKDA